MTYSVMIVIPGGQMPQHYEYQERAKTAAEAAEACFQRWRLAWRYPHPSCECYLHVRRTDKLANVFTRMIIPEEWDLGQKPESAVGGGEKAGDFGGRKEATSAVTRWPIGDLKQ